MKTLTKKQIADYEELCKARANGRILTPAGLRTICSAYNYDPERIGRHFLELLPSICPGDKNYAEYEICGGLNESEGERTYFSCE